MHVTPCNLTAIGSRTQTSGRGRMKPTCARRHRCHGCSVYVSARLFNSREVRRPQLDGGTIYFFQLPIE